MNKTDFAEIFDAVQMDDGAKKVFLNMAREEQLLAILGMQAWMRSELVAVRKEVINTKDDLGEFKKESRRYRIRREKQEGSQLSEDETMSTTEKISQQMNKPWIWFRDKVLPGIVQLATLALLYFIFGGKIPAP
jgi:hypothetical protein